MFSKIIFILAMVCVMNASVLTVNVYDDDPEAEVASNPKGCNYQECDQRCRRLKFPGGACVNGHCKCDNFLNAEDGVSEKTLSDLENSVLRQDDQEAEVAANPSRCNFKACDWVCRSLNNISGACVNGHCKCDNFLNAEDGVSEKTLSDLENSVLQQDDQEAEVAANPSRCNFKACDWVCRSLNNTSGACVNGRCKCAKSLMVEDGVSEKTLSDLENSVLQQDDPKTEFATIGKKCSFKACYSQCRSGNYISGACVKGRCKCSNSTIAKDAVSESNVEDSVSSRACNNKKCDQLCRKKKFRGGACLGANCYCNKFLSQLEDTVTDLDESISLRSCNSIACDDQCRRTGWHSGVCFNGQCKCDYFLNSEDAVDNLEESISLDDYLLSDDSLSTEDAVSDESLPVSELSEDQIERDCNVQACDQLYHRLKFRGGVCVNGRCKCDNFFTTEVDAVDEYSDLDTRLFCKLSKCNRTCIRRGFEVAACVKGRCKCFNISRTSLPLSELSEDQTERGCNMKVCHKLCRRLTHSGGVCVNGRCKCDNVLRTEDDSVDEYSELATRRVCNLRQCNNTCKRRGYATARCVNGICKCYHKILQKEDASPQYDISSDENEESNFVLRGNEEASFAPSPSACNTVSCNQWCHRLKYAGGWCRFGQCQCY